MNRLAIFLLLALGLTARAGVTPGIEYGRAGGESLNLDACVPDGAGPFAAVIVVHGGGWTSDDTLENCVPLFTPLSRAGFAWFAVKYRLAPAHRWPACLEDVETAIRWIKAHAAEFHVDPARLALLGESAGGQIVQMAAVRAASVDAPTGVAALVAFYSPCDNVADSVRRGGPSLSMQALLGIGGKLDAAAEAKLREVSPLNFVHPHLPPCFLVHGMADKSVPYDQSLQWQARLKAHGVACELVTVPGAPHGMGKWETTAGLDLGYKERLVAWLEQTLGPARP